MPTHKDIRIQFEIEGHRYEAVGFLRGNERRIDGEEMFRRTAGENGGVIGEEDYDFLAKHMELFPDSLKGYKLVTNRRPKSEERLDLSLQRDKQVLCFGFNQDRWQRGWGCTCPTCDWAREELVIRRCP